MTEVNREYLVIPDEEEMGIAFASMQGRVTRARQRGEVAQTFGDIGYANANRILESAPHLAEKLEEISRNVGGLITSGTLTVEQAYITGVKDILEILATATTFTQLPEFDDPDS